MKMRSTHPGAQIHRVARMLRRNDTAAERRLWYALRANELCGFTFRRQFPIGNLIVDFCCRKHRLVIELDGSQHASRTGFAQDQRRTALLEARGYRVLRFWNNEVMTNFGGVLDTILMELSQPPPYLPLARGRYQ